MIQPLLHEGLPVAAGDADDREMKRCPVCRSDLLQGNQCVGYPNDACTREDFRIRPLTRYEKPYTPLV